MKDFLACSLESGWLDGSRCAVDVARSLFTTKAFGILLPGPRLPFRRESCRVHRPVRFLIALALLFCVTPGTSEIAEVAVHLAFHGDLPHHDPDDNEMACEHNCTPLSHHCGCHAPMSAHATSRAFPSTKIPDVVAIVPTLLKAVAYGRNGEPPPLRPPIV